MKDSLAEHIFKDDIPKTTGVKIGLLLDEIGILSLSRVRGELIAFNGKDVLDSLLGLKSIHRENGCNGLRYLCVMGSKYKENYYDIGVDPLKTEICVVGNPSYEFCFEMNRFKGNQKRAFLKNSGLPLDKPIFSLFISPSSLSSEQIKEIIMVIGKIAVVEEDALCRETASQNDGTIGARYSERDG